MTGVERKQKDLQSFETKSLLKRVRALFQQQKCILRKPNMRLSGQNENTQERIDVGEEGYYINEKDESLYVQVSQLDYGLYIQKKFF